MPVRREGERPLAAGAGAAAATSARYHTRVRA